MNIERIRILIEEAQKNTTAELGIWFQDFETGQIVAYNEDRVFPTASIYKYFTLAEIFFLVSEKKLMLEQRIVMSKQDQSIGSGVLRNLMPGLELTIYDYAMLMMNLSDNTAADILYELAGRENIYRHILCPLEMMHTKADFTCREMISKYMGYLPAEGETSEEYFARNHCSLRMGKYFTCQEEKNTETTARDLSKFLNALYQKKLVSPSASTKISDILKKCQTNNRIPRFLPAHVQVAHKTGTLDRVANDAGIIYTGHGDYMLILFYNGNLASEEEYEKNYHGMLGDQILADLSRDIYNAYIGR